MAGWLPLAPTSSFEGAAWCDGQATTPARRSEEESVMKRFWTFALSAIACGLLSGVAVAQNTCPDGRTASGQCVNAGLAESMRQAGVIYSQPKLSYTAYPVLPSLDFVFRSLHQLIPDPLEPSSGGTSAPPR